MGHSKHIEPPAAEAAAGGSSLLETVRRFEPSVLIEALKKHGGNQTQTAETLDISTKWLGKLMQRHQLSRKGE